MRMTLVGVPQFVIIIFVERAFPLALQSPFCIMYIVHVYILYILNTPWMMTVTYKIYECVTAK